MALDIEKNISHLVKNQFPDFYKEEGEMFILFVKAYFEWLETNQFYADRDGDGVKETLVQNPADVLHHSRRLSDYRDIDNTLEDFIIDFKNKYLPNVQFNTATNKRLFIKNALEFYRAKGTERAVDLFFKLVYGIEADLYYPGDDLFKLSDNTYENRRYVELVPHQNNVQFVGQTVIGKSSGATAFAEKLIRTRKGSLNIDVLYLAGLDGSFQTGEQIEQKSLDGNSDLSALIIGSLSRYEVLTSSRNFSIGELVKATDGQGKNAKGVITGTRDAVGIVEFSFDGDKRGWGYGPDAQVLGSDRVIETGEIYFTNTDYFYHLDPFKQFDLIKQDLAVVLVDGDANNATSIADIEVGKTIYATANDEVDGTVVFSGLIVDKNEIFDQITINFTAATYTDANTNIVEDDAGRRLFSEDGWTNAITTFWTNNTDGDDQMIAVEPTTNTVSGIIDATLTANVIGIANTFTIEYTPNTSFFVSGGDVLVQELPNTNLIYTTVTVANTFSNTESGRYFMNVIRESGFPRTDQPMKRLSDSLHLPTIAISNVSIGVIDDVVSLSTGAPFKKLANTYSANTQLGSYFPGTANVNSFTYTKKASFTGPSNTREDTVDFFYYESLNSDDELMKINTLNLELNIDETALIDAANTGASDFAYIAFGNGNIIEYSNTTLEDALNYTEIAIPAGSLETIVTTNPGEGYGADPIFVVYEPRAAHLERYDYYIRFKSEGEENDLQKNFTIGEKLTTTGKIAEARIVDINLLRRELICTRLNLANEYDSANTASEESNFHTEDDFRHGDLITGSISGISAIIEEVNEMRTQPRTGLNASINSPSLSGSGFATQVGIYDSGFGYFGKRFSAVSSSYIDGEPLTLQSLKNSERNITAYGFNETNGVAPGSHPSRRSFLSSDKYLSDNDYYQEYSYKVLTALPFSKYKDTLIDVLHLAGTKPFGGYVGTSEENLQITAESDTTNWDIKNFTLFVNQNTFYNATANNA